MKLDPERDSAYKTLLDLVRKDHPEYSPRKQRRAAEKLTDQYMREVGAMPQLPRATKAEGIVNIHGSAPGWSGARMWPRQTLSREEVEARYPSAVNRTVAEKLYWDGTTIKRSAVSVLEFYKSCAAF